MEQTTATSEVNGAILSTLIEWARTTGVKIVVALIILLITFRIIKVVSTNIGKRLEKSGKFDRTLVKTLSYVGTIFAKVVVVTSLVGYLGIDTSGLAALIASLGVGIGLAVNGALANFAGGVLILVTRPFRVGDYIVAQGVEGIVEDIRIISTTLVTVDNKVIHIPNGGLSGATVINYSEKDVRRIDFSFSVGGNDPNLVRKLIEEVCSKEEKVLKDPVPFVRMSDYGAGNGVKVVMRAWVKSSQYWDTYFDLLEQIRQSFDKNGIVIPFNQLDVHIKNS